MPTTPLFSHINAYIKKHSLLTPGSRVILGLSGGPDSLFLLHFLAPMHHAKSIQLIAAHLDHEWRANSHEDVLFCKQVCEQLNIPFVHAKLSELPLTAKPNGSKEEYARKARRLFFEKIKQEQAADLIALAHHQQDQQETFFIRLMRGATPTGLTCMRAKDGVYIRPLLETDKADILAYLEQHGITALQDPSNSSLDFLRNRIRHIVLPALEQSDTRSAQNIKRAIDHLQETETFLTTLTLQTFALLATQEEEKLKVDLNFFRACDPFMQSRLLMHWLITARVPFTPTHALLQEITRFLKQPESKSHAIHPQWRIIKKQSPKQSWAYIERTIS
jgi:tRNA(Ile)-lysidine synthetase-like protein